MIEVRNLYKTYNAKGKPVEALKGVSLSIKEGQILGLLGPNGAGKSTLVKILSTIIKQDSGEFEIDGIAYQNNSEAYRRKIAVVLQNSSLELWLSVLENLRIYGKFFGLKGQALEAAIKKVTEMFGLTPFLHKQARELSGGYRKRLQIAKTFMVETKVLILDEPTEGMDPLVKNDLMKYLRQEAQSGRTILITTQRIEEAEALCDEIVIINNGKIEAQGSLMELRRQTVLNKRLLLHFNALDKHKLKAIEDYCGEKGLRVSFSGSTLVHTNDAGIDALLEGYRQIADRFEVESMEILNPSLEDMFIKVVGGGGK